jgi:hypothetical protein
MFQSPEFREGMEATRSMIVSGRTEYWTLEGAG